jgi:hypothetical protein
VSGLRAGAARLDVAIEQGPFRLGLRLEPSGAPLALEVRPMVPAGARDVAVLVDGAQAERAPGGRVVVALAGRPRRVEIRWTGGLSVEPPLVALEPGQSDRGPRVLDFAAVPDGWRLDLEGPAGSTARLRLHGEAPAGATGASLASSGVVSELTVAFPPSPGPFSVARVDLRRRR